MLTRPPAPEPFAAQTRVSSVPHTLEEPAVWPVSGPARWPLPRRCRGLGTASGHGVRPERRSLLPHVADGRQLPPSAHGEAPSWASLRRRAGRPPLGAHRPAGSLATDRAFNEPIAQLRAAENAGLLSCPLRPRGPPGQARRASPCQVSGARLPDAPPPPQVQVERGSSLLLLPLAGRPREALERESVPGAGPMQGDGFS